MTLSAADQTRFLQALGDDPEFLQRVRQRILTSDLLELPERFAEHVAATNQHFTRLEATLADFMESTNQRLRALEQGQDDLKADMGEVKTNINNLNERGGRNEPSYGPYGRTYGQQVRYKLRNQGGQ